MNNIFAERLKKAMEQKNMKQIDLVKKAAEQGVKLGKFFQWIIRFLRILQAIMTGLSREGL